MLWPYQLCRDMYYASYCTTSQQNEAGRLSVIVGCRKRAPSICIYLLYAHTAVYVYLSINIIMFELFFFMYIEERMVQELVLKAYIRSIESTRILLFFIF